jgi:hypothetical protein
MTRRKTIASALWLCLAAVLPVPGGQLRAAETNVEARVLWLQQQNDLLQQMVRRQQEVIESLSNSVAEIRRNTEQRDRRIDEVEANLKSGDAPAVPGVSLGKVRLSGEGGVGIFESGRQGMAPNAEFRVDEAKLFIDAPVWGDVYAFAEINFATREEPDVQLHLGELYLDFEDVSQLWGRDHQLNIRAGRIDVPFGEEYLERDAIDNPLISHSLSDIWGIDEGLEFYGSYPLFSYAVAVLNGGISDTRDFTADKAVAGRIGSDPARWLHVSVSGMRTGDLDVHNDMLSALWFGGGFFRSIGGATTRTFHANLVEGDIDAHWRRGQVRAFGGYIHYDDNDPAADNHRDVFYYAVEGRADFTRRLYAAARFSQIMARDGFPIVGNGDMGAYLFGPLTTDIWRLSLGVGYRWNRHLVVKTEYALERGRESGGGRRSHEDLVAAEAAFGF